MKNMLIKAAGLGFLITAMTAGASLAAVATSNVNVHTGPSTSYGVIDRLSRGEQVAITDRQGSWCEVSGDNSDGWVRCDYLARDTYRPAPRYGRYDTRQPSVSLSIGTGGFGFGYGGGYDNHPHHGDGGWDHHHGDGYGWDHHSDGYGYGWNN